MSRIERAVTQPFTQQQAHAHCVLQTTLVHSYFVNSHGQQYSRGWRCQLTEIIPEEAFNYHGEMLVDIYHDGNFRWSPIVDAGYGMSTYDPLKGCAPRGGPPECPSLAGNPINLVDGSKIQVEHDLVPASSAELELSRTYLGDGATRPPGMFGPKWRGTYDRRIVLLEGSAPLVAIAYRHDGRGWYFKQGTAGTWHPDGDTPLRLESIYQGTTLAGWKLTDTTDTIEQYDAAGALTRIDTPDGDYRVLTHDALGRVAAVTNRSGRSLSFAYDGAGQALTATTSSGATWSYGYRGVLLQVTGPAGGTRTYVYNESAFAPAAPPGAYLLTGIFAEDGRRFATYEYDAQNRAIASWHAGDANRTRVTYLGNNQAQVVDALGTTTTRAWQISRRGARISSISGRSFTDPKLPTSVSYDANGFADKVTDFAGAVTDVDYDARGLLVQRVESATLPSARRTTSFVHHPTWRVPVEQRVFDSSNALIQLRRWTHNARGQVLTAEQVDPGTGAVRAVSFTYCEQAGVDAGSCPRLGLLLSRNGARTDVADVTTYTYRAADEPSCATLPSTCAYRKGDLWKTTDALGRVTEVVSYDADGRPRKVVDANLVATELEYDAAGRITAHKVRGADDSVETDDRIARFEYWPTGDRKKVTLPDGATTVYTYDAARRLVQVADGEGNTITYTLDRAGKRVQESTRDAAGVLRRTLSRTYDALGQLQTEIDGAGNAKTFTYDARGDLDTTTDAAGRILDLERDPLGRVRRQVQDVGGLGAEAVLERDALDRITRAVDPMGFPTTIERNGLGDAVRLVNPDAGATQFTVNSAGNRVTATDARGKLATMTYDALGRMLTTALPTAALNATRTYDVAWPSCGAQERFAIGKLSRVVDGSGSTVYCYDRFGNLTRKEQVSNSRTLTVRYGRTLQGQLSSITYPDQTIVDYVRDGHGKVQEIGVTALGGSRKVLLAGATYHPFDRWASVTYQGGRVLTRTLDLSYRTSSVLDPAPGGLSLGYQYDALGQLRELRDGAQSLPPRRVMSYDRLGRLTESRDGATSQLLWGYTYDKVGNRTSATVGAATVTYSYAPARHRLIAVGPTTRAYDAAGNTTQLAGSARTLVYGDHGRVSSYRENGVVKMSYVHNARGEMVRRYASSTTNVYSLYDEQSRWLGDYGQTAAPIRQVIWLDDVPVGVLVGAGAAQRLYYVEPDLLGTPRVVIDPTRGAQGTAVWTWDAAGEPFGASPPNDDPDGDGTAFAFEMRLPGQRFEPVSGTTYNVFRTYDAATGRYLESDPLGIAAGFSTYGYVHGQPLTLDDPRGLFVPALAADLLAFLVECAAGCALEILSSHVKCDVERVVDRIARGTFRRDDFLVCREPCLTPCEAAEACVFGCAAGILPLLGLFDSRFVLDYLEDLLQIDICKSLRLE